MPAPNAQKKLVHEKRALKKAAWALIIVSTITIASPASWLSIMASIMLLQKSSNLDEFEKVKSRFKVARIILIISGSIGLAVSISTGIGGAVTFLGGQDILAPAILFGVCGLSLLGALTAAMVLSIAGHRLEQLQAAHDALSDGLSRKGDGKRSTRKRLQENYWEKLRGTCVDIAFSVLFLVYPSCSAIVFSTFDCVELEDGTRFLRKDFQIDCDSATHQAFELFAVVMIGIYPVGVPVLYALAVYINAGNWEGIQRIVNELRDRRRRQEARKLLEEEDDEYDLLEDAEKAKEQKKQESSGEAAKRRNALKQAISAPIKIPPALQRQSTVKSGAGGVADNFRSRLSRSPTKMALGLKGLLGSSKNLKASPKEGEKKPDEDEADGLDALRRRTEGDTIEALTSLGGARGPGGRRGSVMRAPPSSDGDKKGDERNDGKSAGGKKSGTKDDGKPEDPKKKKKKEGEEDEEDEDEKKDDYDPDRDEDDEVADDAEEAFNSMAGEMDVDAGDQTVAITQERKESLKLWEDFYPHCGMVLRAYAGELVIEDVWPTYLLSAHLGVREFRVDHKGEHRDTTNWTGEWAAPEKEQWNEDAVARQVYLEARRPEIEVRARRKMLGSRAGVLPSLVLLLQPLVGDAADGAIKWVDSKLDPTKDIEPAHLERFVQKVVRRDWARMKPRQRSKWITRVKRLGQPKVGDQLMGVVKADGTEVWMAPKFQKKPALGDVTEEERRAFKAIDDDGNGTLDKDELGEGFKLLGFNPKGKVCKALLRKCDLNGDSKFNLIEFSQLMKLLQKAKVETVKDKEKLEKQAHKLLERAGTELSVRDKGHDEVTLLVRRNGVVLKLSIHKGLMPFPLAHRVAVKHAPPAYVRSLTNHYQLRYRYWECFECIRKVTLVGLFLFFGPGNFMQHFAGMIICGLCIMIYNNLKPYDAWQNNLLQQLCQLNIFITLLGGMTIRTMQMDPNGINPDTEFILSLVLIFMTVFATVVVIPVTVLEHIEDPETQAVRAARVLNRARKGAMRNMGMIMLAARRFKYKVKGDAPPPPPAPKKALPDELSPREEEEVLAAPEVEEKAAEPEYDDLVERALQGANVTARAMVTVTRLVKKAALNFRPRLIRRMLDAFPDDVVTELRTVAKQLRSRIKPFEQDQDSPRDDEEDKTSNRPPMSDDEWEALVESLWTASATINQSLLQIRAAVKRVLTSDRAGAAIDQADYGNSARIELADSVDIAGNALKMLFAIASRAADDAKRDEGGAADALNGIFGEPAGGGAAFSDSGSPMRNDYAAEREREVVYPPQRFDPPPPPMRQESSFSPRVAPVSVPSYDAPPPPRDDSYSYFSRAPPLPPPPTDNDYSFLARRAPETEEKPPGALALALPSFGAEPPMTTLALQQSRHELTPPAVASDRGAGALGSHREYNVMTPRSGARVAQRDWALRQEQADHQLWLEAGDAPTDPQPEQRYNMVLAEPERDSSRRRGSRRSRNDIRV